MAAGRDANQKLSVALGCALTHGSDSQTYVETQHDHQASERPTLLGDEVTTGSIFFGPEAPPDVAHKARTI